MNIFRKIFLTLVIALVVFCYGYPMFVLPMGKYKYEKDGNKVEVTFKIDGSYTSLLAGAETSGYYKVKDGKIYVSNTKDVDTSDSGTVLAVVNNMYTISSLGVKMTNNIGTYTMIGVGVASLLLVLTIPASRRRD